LGTTSLGFKVPSTGTIELTDYDVLIDDRSIVKSGADEDVAWNDRSTVTLIVELKTDLEKLSRETGFASQGNLDTPSFGCVINWKSTGSGLHGASPVVTVQDGFTEVILKLDGSQLGGDLLVTPGVILKKIPQYGEYPLSPMRPGSRLWETSIRVRLEGTGSQFPTSTLDFAENGFAPEDALWVVKISADLEAHFSTAIRLYLNTGSKRTAAYVKEPTAQSQEEFASFLEADVVTQLLTFALNSDLAQLKDVAEVPGTFAEALLEIHQTYFPTVLIEDNAENFRHDPGFLHATVLGKTFKRNERKTKK